MASATVKVLPPLPVALNMLVSSRMASTTVKVLPPLPVAKNMLVSGRTASSTDKVLCSHQMAQLSIRVSLPIINLYPPIVIKGGEELSFWGVMTFNFLKLY
jgi:hypothetical protein